MSLNDSLSARVAHNISNEAGPKVTCDGCLTLSAARNLFLYQIEGRECRYCEACRGVFDGFVTACLAEENRLQRLLDLFIDEARSHTALVNTPYDLKDCRQIMPGNKGNLLVLG